MSIASCEKCGRFIDTDDDVDAYEFTDEDCNTIKLEYPLCRNCRDNFIGLVELKKQVQNFTSQVFDWVSMLGQVDFLHRCYDFQAAIDKHIDPKKEKTNG